MNRRHHPKFPKPAAEWLALPLIGLSLLGPASAESLPAADTSAPGSRQAASAVGSPSDLSVTLPFLVTSSERKRLAADLLESIERGNVNDAESRLNAAIDTGTLAIALIDRLNDPNLLSSLKGLNLGEVRHANAAGECSTPAPTLATNLAQMQEALDHEAVYSSMITQTLTDLMEQYNALTARRETDASETLLKVSELQSALQQEQQQRESIEREFATLQADYQTLQASEELSGAQTSPVAAELEAMLQQEQRRSEDAEHQLASAREEARTLLASKDSELKDREAASAARIAELEQALSRAKARSSDFAQQLAQATDALQVLQEADKRKPKPLLSEFAPVEIEAFALLSQQDAPVQPVPDLASAETSVIPREAVSVPVAVASAIPMVQSAPADAAPTREVALAVTASLAPAAAPAAASAAVEPSPAREPAVGPAPAVKPDDRLTARADELLHRGDVSGARLLLERSMKSGNPRAAFLLAETFDPHVLSRLGVLGIRGDADKARELYAQAQALGMPEAAERLQALK